MAASARDNIWESSNPLPPLAPRPPLRAGWNPGYFSQGFEFEGETNKEDGRARSWKCCRQLLPLQGGSDFHMNDCFLSDAGPLFHIPVRRERKKEKKKHGYLAFDLTPHL